MVNSLNFKEFCQYVDILANEFHKSLLNNLAELDFYQILQKQDLYYFKGSNIVSAHDFVKRLVDDRLIYHEEILFNDFLKQMAIYSNSIIFNGQRSVIEGIDLEFNQDGKMFIVSMNNKQNLGEKYSIKQIVDCFERAKSLLSVEFPNVPVLPVYGSFYGIDDQSEKGNYTKLSGQKFWTFISGNPKLYVEIIEPINSWSKVKNDEFNQEYGRILNVFEAEFLKDYCPDGYINWAKLVELNSGSNDL